MFEIFTQILDIATKIREILDKMFKNFPKFLRFVMKIRVFEGIYRLITEKKPNFW